MLWTIISILFVLWLGSLGVKKVPATASVGQKVPAPAGSH